MLLNKHELIMAAHQGDGRARWLLEHDDHPSYIPRKTREYLLMQVRVIGGYQCAICKKPTKYPHIDHKIPVARGGTCLLDNLQVLCYYCNCSKSSHILDPDSYQKGYVKVIDVDNRMYRDFEQKVMDNRS